MQNYIWLIFILIQPLFILIEEEGELIVTLVDFKGTVIAEGTLLHWTTAFEKVGTVTASVSPAGSAYRFLHAVHREYECNS
ncbi:hypothetical protein [Dyadobacter helix]|uniref:hypothetical protein n=1 Tax=Dyadobacter helix TaxID=2822344 RepID=UPI001BFC618F|nr:hypothetical protein [Dyadobacter sp. CECT 9275]